MFPNTQKFLAVLVLSLSILACGGSPDNNGPTGPAVTAVDPSSGSFNGGTAALIYGSGFKTGATVTFGGVHATVQTMTADNIWISATPPHVLGAVNVVVTNPDGGIGTCVNCFTYIEAPVDIARRVLGSNNVFGIEENEKYFGITLSAADKAQYYNTYTEATLTAKKDTHMLVLVLPGVSIADLQAKLPAGTIAFCDAWNASQLAFGKMRAGSWHLIRKDPAPGSLGLLQSQQFGKLAGVPIEAPPEALTLVYAMAGHYLATGEVLMPSIFGRTLDNTAPGGTNLMTAFVGGNAYGAAVGICSDWGEIASPVIGMAAEWYPR